MMGWARAWCKRVVTAAIDREGGVVGFGTLVRWYFAAADLAGWWAGDSDPRHVMGAFAASLATILGSAFFFLSASPAALVGVGQPGCLGGRGSWGSWGQQQKKGCQADGGL